MTRDSLHAGTVLLTLTSAVFVAMMQAGFALLAKGVVRKRNTINILTKNLIDVCISGVSFFLVGYSFAYGDSGNDFIGGQSDMFAFQPAVAGNTTYMWLYQWAFAAAAATIVSGAVAERCSLYAYLIYSTIITSFIYPVVVKWCWGGGWLSKEGYLDFAGSGVIHMVGGTAALVGATVLGPRIGRFEGGYVVPDKHSEDQEMVNEYLESIEGSSEFEPSDPTFQTLGVFLLWTGWFFFNAGSAGGLGDDDSMYDAGLAAMNSAVSPSAAAVTSLIIQLVRGSIKKDARTAGDQIHVDLGELNNAVLGGLVAITAGCANMYSGYALLSGVISVPVLMGSSAMLKALKIDDPLDASPVHCFCGYWGVVACGLFYSVKGGLSNSDNYGKRLGANVYGGLAIFGWTAATSFILFFSLKMAGILRVSPREEIMGLDLTHHIAKDDWSSNLVEHHTTPKKRSKSPLNEA